MFVWGIVIVVAAAAVISLREARRAAVWTFYAFCMLTFFLAWECLIFLFTAVPRFVYGRCPDPECDGSLRETPETKLAADRSGVIATRRCTSCGCAVDQFTSFAEIEESIINRSQPYGL